MKKPELVVLPRLFLAMAFLATVIGKLSDPAAFQTQMVQLLTRWAQNLSFGWYASFINSMVLPHQKLFAVLVMIGELYVGIAMLFGITTRLAAAVAIFLALNYLCAKGSMPWNASSVDMADIVLCLVVMIGAAGRSYGVDEILHRRYPNIPAW